MKKLILGIVLLMILVGCTQMADKNQTTIKGKYLESKLGPDVDGVLLDQDFQEQYRGKTVEVTGVIYMDDSFVETVNEEGEYIQGTGSPIKRMKDISSIKVVK